MLSGKRIIEEVKVGNIVIDPFRLDRVNSNSYNLSLGEELVVYKDDVLDCKKENPTRMIKIPKEGYILSPGVLYLAKCEEYTENPKYIPQISGRSSIGRIGLTVHIAGGFGNLGFNGTWTLGISSTTPVKIYPGMQICQIYFFPVTGDPTIKYKGKYSNTGDKVLVSQIHKEF